MKLNNKLIPNPIMPLNPKACACGELMEPLKLLLSERIVRDPKVYSQKGFIKGVGILNKVKNLKYGFSTKDFGNMAFKYGETAEVVSNRTEFMKAVGISIKDSVFMKPNHGRKVEVVSSSHRGRGAYEPGMTVGPADALITFDKGVALGLNSADCVPLIITSVKSDVLALVHAGRVGTDAKIAKTTIKKMMTYGVLPEDLIVGIGPAIQKSCYKLKYLETEIPYQWLPWVRPVLSSSRLIIEKCDEIGKQHKIKAKKGQIFVDIVGFNIAQLMQMGVKSENIDIAPICALCMARRGEIFSHFLSSQFKDSKLFPEGRFMSIAQLK